MRMGQASCPYRENGEIHLPSSEREASPMGMLPDKSASVRVNEPAGHIQWIVKWCGYKIRAANS